MALLTPADQKKIETAINNIYFTTGTSYPENNLLEIVKKLNIEVYLTDFGEQSDEVSGMIKKGNETEKTQILLNEKESSARRTFTLAHELGHFILNHQGDEQYRIDKYNYSQNTPEAKQETEANYFAASLLMPKKKFSEILNTTNNIKAIADYFGVSETAVVNRIRWLQQN
jgi:Zn-dependent peptidase ImmA (M78 family)